MKVIIDASNISPEILIWLKQANDGHYYIERLPNRHETSMNRFPVSIAFAEKLQTMTTEEAWFAMERFLGFGDGQRLKSKRDEKQNNEKESDENGS